MEMAYDIGVIIGRFQPIHNGHISLFEEAAARANKTICIIGSANQPSNIKNPFSAAEREYMIRESLAEIAMFHINFEYVEDSHYREQAWVTRVKEAVNKYVPDILAVKEQNSYKLRTMYKAQLKTFGIETDYQMDVHINLHGSDTMEGHAITQLRALEKECKTCHIAVFGHMKDDSSYYLNSFADWDKFDVENKQELNASDIRDLWLTGKLSYVRSNVSKATYDFMSMFPGVGALIEEYEYVKKYRADTQVGPFPVQFLTTDAVVVHGDEVLMIRRGVAPGKGLWALPGGFKNENETFFDSCVRELQEETKIALPEIIIRKAKTEEKMFDYPSRSIRGTTVSMVYSFVLDPTKPRPRVKGADDAVAAWWFPLSELKNMRDQIFEDHLDMIEYMTSRL